MNTVEVAIISLLRLAKERDNRYVQVTMPRIYQHNQAHILHCDTHPSRHVACDISPPSFGSLMTLHDTIIDITVDKDNQHTSQVSFSFPCPQEPIFDSHCCRPSNDSPNPDSRGGPGGGGGGGGRHLDEDGLPSAAGTGSGERD